MSEWTSVKDKMPEDGQEVFTYHKTKHGVFYKTKHNETYVTSEYQATYREGKFYKALMKFDMEIPATHWKPYSEDFSHLLNPHVCRMLESDVCCFGGEGFVRTVVFSEKGEMVRRRVPYCPLCGAKS